jgi:predicted AAA+ superfamily ATPase
MDNRFFAIKNPWRSSQPVKPPAIRRTCLDDLDLWMKDDEVLVVYGPRRVGKSTLLLSIVAELLKRPGTNPQDLFFFDLDTLDCSDVLATPGTLIDFIGMPERRTFVLIDEVQTYANRTEQTVQEVIDEALREFLRRRREEERDDPMNP